MDLSQSTDYMNLLDNKLAFPFINNDLVLFSGEIYKINRYWTTQKRILCVTSKYILNLKRDKYKLDKNNKPDLTGLWCKRIIDIKDLGGVTTSLHRKSFEFVIHVPKEYDYRYDTQNQKIRKEIIDAIKLAYLSTCKDSLKIYGVPNKYLGQYTKNSNSRSKVLKIPDSKYI